ncbi:MAG: J domain-containing protein [Treponema sp.]|nr:J domain-containing protein [Treponema sp.]
MPDSMYDRLGDMLHDVLESGAVPVHSAINGTQTAEEHIGNTRTDKNDAFADKKSAQPAEDMPPWQKSTTSEQNRQNVEQPNQNISRKKKRQPPVYHVIPADVRAALAFFGLNEMAGHDEAKKAYHEKLKYYHPDRHGSNPVLQKVAREKTRSVIAAWKTLERFFS